MNRSGKDKKYKGVSLDEISLSVSSTGIIISTGNAHHLTIFIDSDRKILNAHLTQEMPGSAQKVYLASVSLDLKGLEEYSNWVFRVFYSMLTKVKIEVLNRKGYVLFYDDKKRIDRLMAHDIKRHATIERKKFRPNLKRVREFFSSTEKFEKMVRDPKVLYDSRTKKDRPIWASVVYRKKKAPPLQIFYLPVKGFEGWYSLNTKDYLQFMQEEVMPMFADACGDFLRLADEKMGIAVAIERLFKKDSGS